MIDKKKWDLVINGSIALRKAVLRREPKLFAVYYFTEYFKYKIPEFHDDLYSDCVGLTNGTLDEALWCVFRDGAKTSIAKTALLCWVIAFKLKMNIKWDSYEQESGEAALFDVTVALQTNKRLIADFGQLYYKKATKEAMSEAKMKRLKNFKTEHGVSVAAVTTQQALRARNLQGSERTDLYIVDDIENNKTKDSSVITGGVIKHIDELRSGLSAGASVLYLGNFVTDSGSIAYIMDVLKGNPRAVVRFVPVTDSKGKIAWPDKFVKTDAEAVEVNREIADPKRHKLSLEAKRRSLTDAVYEAEMMLNPAKSGDLFFDRFKVMKAIEQAREPETESAGFKMWGKFNPRHRYGGGADTAEGIGGDSNASCWFDFSATPNLLIGSFEDNQMPANTFGWELKRQGGIFGFPFLVPEINQTGYATISELINANYPQLYQREVKNKTNGQMQKELGWKATVGTKHEIMADFKTSWEDGEFEIYDLGLLEEMKFYKKSDARIANREKGATRHFDKLRAAALAWHARKWAPAAKEDQKKLYDVPGLSKEYRL